MISRRRFVRSATALAVGASLSVALSGAEHLSPLPVGLALPTRAQLAWQEAERGVLFHFDPRIFNRQLNSSSLQSACRTPLKDANGYAQRFDPSALDLDQWLKTAQAMGARLAILVVKHETGFCLWQSDANPFCLKHIAWRVGQADLLGDFIASCRRYELHPGIFTEARWDLRLGVQDFKVSAQSLVTQEQYNHLIEREVEELCTRYPKLFQIWFDGGVLSPAQGGPDVLPILDKYQPGILFYHSDQRRDVRWGGTESGKVAYPCWATVDPDRIQTGKPDQDYLMHGDPQGRAWCPAMSDAPLRCENGRHDWLWQPGGEVGTALLEHFPEMYFSSVGHKSTLILGLTPDRSGLPLAPDVARRREFGSGLTRKFPGKLIAETLGSGSRIALRWSSPMRVGCLILGEDIAYGERVQNYSLQGQLPGGHWQELSRGQSIEHIRMKQLEAIELTAVELRLDRFKVLPGIRQFAAYADS